MTTENYTGTDCSGSDGDANRILTLSNTSLSVSNFFSVYVSGLIQHSDDLTISHNSSGTTITFLKNLWNNDPIKVNYYTVLSPPPAVSPGVIPFDQRFIQKNIGAVGNTCTIRSVAVTVGSDEYRTVSEVDTDYEDVSCLSNYLSAEDESVKQGEARAGDMVFWFDAGQNSRLSRTGNTKIKIIFNSRIYQVNNIIPHYAVGNTLFLLEVRTQEI